MIDQDTKATEAAEEYLDTVAPGAVHIPINNYMKREQDL